MSTPGWPAIASPTSGPVPVTMLKTPGGQAGGLDDLGEDEGVERHDLARLEHHGAAGGEGGGDLGGDLVERVVPGRDRAEHADRLAQDPRVADLLLPGDFLHQPRHRRELAGGQARLDHLAQLERHAELLGDRRRDLLGALAEPGGDRREVAGALLARGLRPGLEGLAGGEHGAVGVGGGAGRDRADDLLGRVELITSSVSVAWGSTHSPPMKTLSRAWSSAAVAISSPPVCRRRRLAARPTLARRERRRVVSPRASGPGRASRGRRGRGAPRRTPRRCRGR